MFLHHSAGPLSNRLNHDEREITQNNNIEISCTPSSASLTMKFTIDPISFIGHGVSFFANLSSDSSEFWGREWLLQDKLEVQDKAPSTEKTTSMNDLQ